MHEFPSRHKKRNSMASRDLIASLRPLSSTLNLNVQSRGSAIDHCNLRGSGVRELLIGVVKPFQGLLQCSSGSRGVMPHVVRNGRQSDTQYLQILIEDFAANRHKGLHGVL